MPTAIKRLTVSKAFPYILIVCGIIGLLAATIITIEKFDLLSNPNYKPSCNLNPVISCGSVMQSKQAAAFGVPNPFIGLAGFSVLITTGVVLLNGVKLKRWYYLGLQAGGLFGIGFVHWLFFQSVYRIHALCPYCMAVWVVTITTFWYTLMYNLDNGSIKPAKGWQANTANWVRKHHLDLLVLWFLIIAGLILKHFWYYYGHYF